MNKGTVVGGAGHALSGDVCETVSAGSRQGLGKDSGASVIRSISLGVCVCQ
jgi:hypothetical protein